MYNFTNTDQNVVNLDDPRTLGTGSGNFKNYKPLTMIGRSPKLSENKYVLAEGIPTPNSNLDITYPLIKTKLSIVSTDERDHILGEGSRVVLVEGLDMLRNPITEMLSLTGTTKVISEKEFFRINKLTVISTGEFGKNQGFIYCSNFEEKYINGIPQKLCYHSIGIGTNMSMVSIYSMTNAKWYDKAIGVRFLIATDATQENPIDLEVKMTPDGFPELTTAYMPITYNSTSFNLIDAGDGLPPNADTRVLGSLRQGGGKSILLYYSFVLKKIKN